MRNIKLVISYHGKYFSGWQIQNSGVKTVQEELQSALSKFFKENIKLTGSGRTDSGVHAIAQTANFITKNEKIPLKGIIYGVNGLLPQGVRIMNAWEVDLNFNARKSAKKKTYLYQIYNSKIISPLEEDFFYHCKYDLDFEKMKLFSKYFLGEHDFKAFAASLNSTNSTIRKIYDINWKKEEEKIFFEITGNGFLMKMVRNIIGTLIEIGNGKSYDIPKIIKSRNRDNAGFTAPAKGLFLKEVIYD